MTITARVMHATYDPIARYARSQDAYIMDHLCYDYYHEPREERYAAAPNVNGIFRGRRFFAAAVCKHYLCRKARLEENVRRYIMPYYIVCNCVQSVMDDLHTIVRESDIHPLDIADLERFYALQSSEEGCARYITEVVWYVMQTDRFAAKRLVA